DVEPTVRESLLFTSHTNKLWLLASIDAKRALPVLKQVSQTSANEKVRAEAATILGKIRQKYGYK
ncbi:MAG: hypothetical protein SFU56_17860, partial [Capsulimonadales bacterium]|nr:hypothetical protein [Capsulimonadales bacterium]